MTEEQERCETCRFWKQYIAGSDSGVCRRYPRLPVMDFNSDRDSDRYYSNITHEPSLMPKDEWCGEYKAKA